MHNSSKDISREVNNTNRIGCLGMMLKILQETRKNIIEIERSPDIVEVKKFWQNIPQQEVKHNEDVQGINYQEEQLQVNQM